jgi:hypothetical protein
MKWLSTCKCILLLLASVLFATNTKSQTVTPTEIARVVDSLMKVKETTNQPDLLSIQLSCDEIPIYQLTQNKDDERSSTKNSERIPLSKQTQTFKILRLSAITFNGFLTDINIFGIIPGQKGIIKFLYTTPVSIRNIHNEKVIRRAWLDTQNSQNNALGLNRDCFLWLKDVLKINNETGAAYLPANAHIELEGTVCDSVSNPSSQHVFYFQRNLRDIFKASIYTDALSLFGKYPNGLVQAEASISYHPNVRTIGNTGLILADYIRLKGIYRRFDESAGIYYTSAYDTFNRAYFNQKSFFTSESKLGLFAYYFKGRRINSEHLLFVNIGHQLDLIKTAIVTTPGGHNDTLMFNGNNGVMLQSFLMQTGFHFNLQRNVQIEFNATHYLQWFSNTANDTIHFPNVIGQLFKLEGYLSWSPNDAAQTIFLRTTAAFAVNQKPRNAYFQLQLGYSIDFTQLLGQAALKAKK